MAAAVNGSELMAQADVIELGNQVAFTNVSPPAGAPAGYATAPAGVTQSDQNANIANAAQDSLNQ